MRTKNFLKHLILGALLLATGKVVGQSTTPGNVAFGPTDFLGWDNTGSNNFPLMVRHDLNQPIDWYTNAIQRLTLLPDANYTIGGFAGVDASGFALLSPDVVQFYANGAPGPYTIMHVADGDDNASQASFRNWMRVGVTFTGNRDQGYIGQKAAESDYTDMVVNWSDNTGKWLKDRMRFLFTTEYDPQAVTGATSLEGLEFIRLYPVGNNKPYVGIGDWHAANINSGGAITEPEERLDIVDGRVRIRDLPPYGNMPTETRFVVSDASGVLGWRDVSSLPDNCEWGLFGGANGNNLWTAEGTSTSCPNQLNLVGIGTSNPIAKLHVRLVPATGLGTATAGYFHMDNLGGTAGAFSVNGSSLFNCGVDVIATGAQSENDTQGNVGIRSRSNANVSGFTGSNRAVVAHANVLPNAHVGQNFIYDGIADISANATIGSNFGLRAQLWNYYGTTTNNYGAHLWSWAGSSAALTNSYGVYSIAEGGSAINYGGYFHAGAGATNVWAVFANGSGLASGGTWVPSDSDLKMNMEEADAASAGDVLAQVQLYNYLFNPDACPQLDLPQGPQLGVRAEDLELLMPHWVKNARQPAEMDQAGNEVHPAYDLKVVRMEAFVPYLIAGYQEQQATIAIMQEQIAQFQEQLAACCAAPTDSDQRNSLGETGAVEGPERNLQIIPNPMESHATLTYTLDHSGAALLMVNAADGKDLRTLMQANLEAGQYQLEWNIENLAPGTYYVTLFLDGERIVKKAVKVQR